MSSLGALVLGVVSPTTWREVLCITTMHVHIHYPDDPMLAARGVTAIFRVREKLHCEQLRVLSTSAEDASYQDRCYTSNRYITDIHVTIQGACLFA